MSPNHASSSSFSSLSFLTSPLLCAFVAQVQAIPSVAVVERDSSNPLNIHYDPAPPPDEGPSISAGALRDTAYLPAQIGGIVGAYAFSLVLVAITLLALAKKRREHLAIGESDFDPAADAKAAYDKQTFNLKSPSAAVPNFSYPSPTRTEFNVTTNFVRHPSANSSICAPGINLTVDQGIVAADRAMAQQQLEDMYKLVMDHEDAKQRGAQFDPPAYPTSPAQRPDTLERNYSSTSSKKERSKPASLNLNATKDERQSKTSSFLSALRSPKKKSVKGINISSPILTPQSGTFPRQHTPQEMTPIPPRQYAPPPPPPIPTDQLSFGLRNSGAPITPDMSPQSVQSIDERIGFQLSQSGHARTASQAITEGGDPESATSEHSQAPLVGLPSSPKPGATFPSLPSSPKPGATFDRPNPTNAVRTGGALPLRAYEHAMTSPTTVQHTTKQTVFERKGNPLSPMSARTPGTSVPYSPYQPFTPCVPMTPTLVTKEDRKRMKRMVPKTPTIEMVQSSDDVW